jgi:hypothetical protein
MILRYLFDTNTPQELQERTIGSVAAGLRVWAELLDGPLLGLHARRPNLRDGQRAPTRHPHGMDPMRSTTRLTSPVGAGDRGGTFGADKRRLP